MVLKTYVFPSVIEGYGTTQHANMAVREYFFRAGAVQTYGTLGHCYTSKGYVYAYNIEVCKRKKHKHDGAATYKAYIYKISERWLLDNKKAIKQFPRYFRIVDK